jgi:hypothetical protein
LTSTKHSARTPDSTRKSVSAVGLSKLQILDADDTESALGDLDDVSARNRHQKRRANSVTHGVDSHSTTSSSSDGISLKIGHQNNISVSFCYYCLIKHYII